MSSAATSSADTAETETIAIKTINNAKILLLIFISYSPFFLIKMNTNNNNEFFLNVINYY